MEMVNRLFEEDCRKVEKLELSRDRLSYRNLDSPLYHSQWNTKTLDSRDLTYHVIAQEKRMTGPVIPNLLGIYFPEFDLHGTIALYRFESKEKRIWHPSLSNPFKKISVVSRKPEFVFYDTFILAGDGSDKEHPWTLDRFIELMLDNCSYYKKKGERMKSIPVEYWKPIFEPIFQYYKQKLEEYMKNKRRNLVTRIGLE